MRYLRQWTLRAMLAAVLAASLLFALYRAEAGISRAQFNSIKKGMSQNAVQAILGMPDERDMLERGTEWFYYSNMLSLSPTYYYIEFDEKGCVSHKDYWK